MFLLRREGEAEMSAECETRPRIGSLPCFSKDIPPSSVTLKYPGYLAFPRKFYESHCSGLDKSVILKVSRGKKWEVKLGHMTKQKTIAFRGSGWLDFVKENGVRAGDQITFTMLSASVFSVRFHKRLDNNTMNNGSNDNHHGSHVVVHSGNNTHSNQHQVVVHNGVEGSPPSSSLQRLQQQLLPVVKQELTDEVELQQQEQQQQQMYQQELLQRQQNQQQQTQQQTQQIQQQELQPRQIQQQETEQSQQQEKQSNQQQELEQRQQQEKQSNQQQELEQRQQQERQSNQQQELEQRQQQSQQQDKQTSQQQEQQGHCHRQKEAGPLAQPEPSRRSTSTNRKRPAALPAPTAADTPPARRQRGDSSQDNAQLPVVGSPANPFVVSLPKCTSVDNSSIHIVFRGEECEYKLVISRTELSPAATVAAAAPQIPQQQCQHQQVMENSDEVDEDNGDEADVEDPEEAGDSEIVNTGAEKEDAKIWITVKASNLAPYNRLSFPKNFANRWLPATSTNVTVVDGKNMVWPMSWIVSGKRMLGKGWSNFAKHYSLDVGHRCLLKVLESRKISVDVYDRAGTCLTAS